MFHGTRLVLRTFTFTSLTVSVVLASSVVMSPLAFRMKMRKMSSTIVSSLKGFKVVAGIFSPILRFENVELIAESELSELFPLARVTQPTVNLSSLSYMCQLWKIREKSLLTADFVICDLFRVWWLKAWNNFAVSRELRVSRIAHTQAQWSNEEDQINLELLYSSPTADDFAIKLECKFPLLVFQDASLNSDFMLHFLGIVDCFQYFQFRVAFNERLVDKATEQFNNNEFPASFCCLVTVT